MGTAGGGGGAGSVVEGTGDDLVDEVTFSLGELAATASRDDPAARVARARDLLAPARIAAFHLALLHDVLAGRDVHTTDHLAARTT